MSALSRKNLWEKTPAGVKRALGAALSVAPPTFWLGRAFREQLAFAESSQHWSRDKAEAWTLDRLRDIVRLAAEQSPFFQRHFADAGFDAADLKSLDDLNRLPTIDKTTIREHGDAMLTQPKNAPGVDYVTTGGSGGAPMGFHIGADRSAIEYAYLVAGWRRAGFGPNDTQAVFRGQVVAPDRTGLRHNFDPILRRHYYSNFHMTDDNMDRYVDHLSTIGACYLHVYPSSMATLTRYLQRADRRLPGNVRGILAGSEIVYDADREATEQLTGLRYYSWYGHSEKLVLAAECEHSSLYHVWPTYGHCELLDEAGRPVTEIGRRGEIVGTGFINRVMPFIRYRTGDFATLAGLRCEACGRDHMLLADIQGHRTQEMLICADGAEISWTAVNMHDRTFDGVLRFQFRQTTPGVATLRLVPGAGFDSSRTREIKRSLDRKLEGRIVFDVALCDEIELTHRGKTTFVDQRIPDVGRIEAGAHSA
ncbi:MAG: phenylacetate--CoA ligase family protein [Phycisphaerales bacterium]|nr:phenylacetate--CoA ligase family protein [Phycisphaerales bacterium]